MQCCRLCTVAYNYRGALRSPLLLIGLAAFQYPSFMLGAVACGCMKIGCAVCRSRTQLLLKTSPI